MEAALCRRLIYKRLRRDKVKSLQHKKGNMKQRLLLYIFLKKDSHGWKIILWQPHKVWRQCQYNAIIYTNASLDGWGQSLTIWNRRHVNQKEQGLHIKAIQLLGAKLGLLSFFKDNANIKHIRIMMENNTAVAYINNMRKLKSDLCDDIAFNKYGFQ